MRQKEARSIHWVALVTLWMMVGGVAAMADPESSADAAEEAFVATHKCVTCHSVDAVGIEPKSEKMRSIDLSGYASEDLSALARFLRKEEERNGEDHKKAYKGTDEELQAIVDWLSTLEPSGS